MIYQFYEAAKASTKWHKVVQQTNDVNNKQRCFFCSACFFSFILFVDLVVCWLFAVV